MSKGLYLGILIECKFCDGNVKEFLRNYKDEIERSIERGRKRGYIYKLKDSKLYCVKL